MLKHVNTTENPTLPPRTDVLEALRGGRHDSLDRLMPMVYDELRAIAHRHLAGRRSGDSLVTQALVNEAYLKMVDQSQARWKDRAHFLALASVAMRQVLVDRARARMALKRGGSRRSVTLDDDTIAVDSEAESLLEIDDALERLSRFSPRLAHIVECRFYGGLSHEEIAEALGVTVRTVERDWAKARMLLREVLVS